MGAINRWKQMRSANETKYRKVLSNKLSIIIFLWFLEKLIMLIMLYALK